MSTDLPLTLGLDLSTQSLSAVILDPREARVVHSHSIAYARDPRLGGSGIDPATMVLPAEAGRAEQPASLFLRALDALFHDLQVQGAPLARVGAINSSAQQHGHVYLSAAFEPALKLLHQGNNAQRSLETALEHTLTWPTAPIWKTSDTASQADEIRVAVGGRDAMVALSGSDSPLRFTGAVIRRVGQESPALYGATWRIKLLSAWIAAILSGRADAPTDHGNAAGMSLMDYRQRVWSPRLVEAVSRGLPGGSAALMEKLGPLAPPQETVGSLGAYFSTRYGLSPSCRVLAGSGDNPQTKVLFQGDLLSLGTSFVYMGAFDHPDANAMYDGLDRAFSFGCRTNGALVWDAVARDHGVSGQWERYSQALDQVLPHQTRSRWAPEMESFPQGEPVAREQILGPRDFAHEYAGVVDYALQSLYEATAASTKPLGDEPLNIAGGPASNPAIQRRIASLWNRPVRVVGAMGAALGAAVAAAPDPVALAARLGDEAPIQKPDVSLVQSWKQVLGR